MKSAGSFFDKFKNLALQELHKREVVSGAIFEITRQNIDIKDISIKNRTVYVKCDQGLKSEIFIKKKSIINLIFKEINILDIK